MISQAKFNLFARDPEEFRHQLLVDVDGSVRQFGDVQDEWQKADFAALDAGLMRANGRSEEPGKLRAWFERPRGHSKTTDLAVTCVWLMAFATRPVRGFGFAVDQDQSKLLKNAMDTLLRLNPWLGEILEVQKNSVVNIAKGHPGAGSTLEISTSDVASSYGILPDFIIADELTHWDGDGSLWHSLISSAAKRSHCLLVVIANAGFADSWQWDVREAARTDEAWVFSRLDGPQASWMTPERLAEQRRMLPPVAYARLWENCWSSGGGDALTADDVHAAFQDDLRPMTGTEKGWYFVGGVDLGLTRDCSAFVVLAVPDGRSGKIRLAHTKLWRPALNQKVSLQEVETHLLKIDRQFKLEGIGFDPWQAELLATRVEAESKRRRRNQRRRFWANAFMREITPTAANLRDQAGLVIEYIGDRRLELFHDANLKRDLLKLRAEEKAYGIRLVSPRDEFGHGDTASAFSNALLIAHEYALKRRTVVGAYGNDKAASTSFDRNFDTFEQHKADYEADQKLIAESRRDPHDNHGWREAMRRFGRYGTETSVVDIE